MQTLSCALYHQILYFFQAEDGIRDYKVIGVQTCALPILAGRRNGGGPALLLPLAVRALAEGLDLLTELAELLAEEADLVAGRSEERRVGEECRARWGRGHEEKGGVEQCLDRAETRRVNAS